MFSLLSGAAMFCLTLEASAMLEKMGIPSFPRFSACSMALFFWKVCADKVFPSCGMAGLLPLVLLLFGGWLSLLWSGDRLFVKKFICSCGIFLFLSIPFLMLLNVYFSDDSGGGTDGVSAGAINFLFLTLVTKSMDTGGYVAGMLTDKLMNGGNHKLVPALSPKKSVEGTAGGILLSMATASVLFAVGWVPDGTGVIWCVLSGLFLGIGSLAGDLTESALKRACGVKDSANLIPGMGGVFDVLDSFIYNGFIFEILLIARF